jgi:hypothetical protein
MAKSWLLALAVVTLAAAPAVAETLTPITVGGEEYFTLTWQPTPGGIRGQIANNSGFPATNVRVLVDSLDDNGNVIAQTLGHVNWQVAAGQAAPFDVQVPGQATNFKVSLFQFDWAQFGSGGEGGDGL